MPFANIESVSSWNGCACFSLGNVSIKAKIDGSPHYIEGVRDADSFVKLVNAMIAAKNEEEGGVI